MKKLLCKNKHLADRWNDSNLWFMEDEELTEEAFNIHSKLKDQNAEVDIQEYWDKIDIELYRNKKSRLLRYFSHKLVPGVITSITSLFTIPLDNLGSSTCSQIATL